jgi:hypothetical protein
MSQDNVIDDVVSEMNRAFAQVINASTEFAVALIELRVQRLREAARHDEEQARIAREQTRMQHQADSAVWRAAMRPQWWRDAGAEDIGRVWRAASTWKDVDPRAAEARQVVVDRLAERGVHVDPGAARQPGPEDVAWVSDALDRAAAERAARAAAGDAGPGQARPEPDRGAAPGENPAVIDGEASQAPATEQPHRTAQDREKKAAEHVRAAWPAERAVRVIGCRAWGVLANQLDQVEQQGHDVQALLRGVPDFVDRAHTPAAFAFRSIEDRLAGLVDLGTQSSRDTRTPAQADTTPAESSTAAGVAEEDRRVVQTPDPEAADAPAVVVGQVSGNASVAEVQAATGDGRAAQVAAQAYPISTKLAVAAAADKAEAGTAAGTGSAPAGTRSTRSLPGPQQSREEPQGR